MGQIQFHPTLNKRAKITDKFREKYHKNPEKTINKIFGKYFKDFKELCKVEDYQSESIFELLYSDKTFDLFCESILNLDEIPVPLYDFIKDKIFLSCKNGDQDKGYKLIETLLGTIKLEFNFGIKEYINIQHDLENDNILGILFNFLAELHFIENYEKIKKIKYLLKKYYGINEHNIYSLDFTEKLREFNSLFRLWWFDVLKWFIEKNKFTHLHNILYLINKYSNLNNELFNKKINYLFDTCIEYDSKDSFIILITYFKPSLFFLENKFCIVCNKQKINIAKFISNHYKNKFSVKIEDNKIVNYQIIYELTN